MLFKFRKKGKRVNKLASRKGQLLKVNFTKKKPFKPLRKKPSNGVGVGK